jgi:Ser/Thr protein kinase RdoA (MazF antagonist)
VDLLATGRTAEVYAIRNNRVLKLDRLEWNGVSHFEANVLTAAHTAGLPVPEVYETVTIDDRHGIVLERIHGPSLTEILAAGDDTDGLARHFVDLHQHIQAGALPGLPDLVARLDDEIRRSGLLAVLGEELRKRLAVLAQGQTSCVCHFDLHPDNIIVTDQRWVVIDWLTAANGPAIADHARTLLLRADATDPVTQTFISAVQRYGHDRRGFDDANVAAWIRIVAAARLAEGFNGSYADLLTTIATTTA